VETNKEKADFSKKKMYRACLYENKHRFKDCPYLMEAKHLTSWTLDKGVEKLMEEKIKASPKLQAILSKVRGENRGKSRVNEEEEGTSPTIFFAAAYSASSDNALNPYPLRDSILLECGATINVCNNLSCVTNFTPTVTETIIYARSNMLPLDGFSRVHITLKLDSKDDKSKTVRLHNVAYVPLFHTSVVSLQQFEAIGGAWNSRYKTWTCGGKLFCYILDKFSQ
jgi:hypothetical protein